MFENMDFKKFHLGKKIYESSSSLIYKTKSQTPNIILKILKSESYFEQEVVRLHQEFSVSKYINSPYVAKEDFGENIFNRSMD
jgi:hypothetical protein